MLHLYDYLESGNGYKVRLALSQLQIPFELRLLDILKGETRTPTFLAMNPNGRIPVLAFPDGRFLWESNAILYHLAQGTALWPDEAFHRAQVLQWMCFEQYSHEPYIATVRFWTFSGVLSDHAQEVPARRKQGYAALDVMERHLASRAFFVADHYSIADIALYAYTHVASEGGYDLSTYPALQTWLQRVASQPRYVAMADHCGHES